MPAPWPPAASAPSARRLASSLGPNARRSFAGTNSRSSASAKKDDRQGPFPQLRTALCARQTVTSVVNATKCDILRHRVRIEEARLEGMDCFLACQNVPFRAIGAAAQLGSFFNRTKADISGHYALFQRAPTRSAPNRPLDN